MQRSLFTFCLSWWLGMAGLMSTTSIHAQTFDPTTNSFSITVNELLNDAKPPDLQAWRTGEPTALRTLYNQRNFASLWYRNNRPTTQAFAILNILRDASEYGLRAADYAGTTLAYRLNAQTSLDEHSDAAMHSRAQLEVALSVAVLHFIRDLHYGRIDPRKVGFNLSTTRAEEFDAMAQLVALSNSGNTADDITKLEPRFLHYQLLKNALARYRLLSVDEELTQLPGFTERSIKPDAQYVGAPALRRLLAAEQDLRKDGIAPDTDTSLDPALSAALQRYQTRHGLLADGALGKSTFAALTTPFATRVRQIEFTLERWRWLPALQSPMIVVNIPQFKLFAFKSPDDRETNLLRMDVIVGQTFEHTQTPIFLADLKYVVFRPYWDVPPSIVKREMLGAIQRDANYLQRNRLELVRGQGDNSPVVAATPENIAQLATGKLRVRQLPGDTNALGEVKFMLPNSYNVYLHSTPAKQLFSQSRRAFSHGCIRVSDPTALAEYVLGYAKGEWHKDQIEAAMHGKDNQRINLNQTIPVMIVYGTAMANEAGEVLFFEDIYGHDKKLAKLL